MLPLVVYETAIAMLVQIFDLRSLPFLNRSTTPQAWSLMIALAITFDCSVALDKRLL